MSKFNEVLNHYPNPLTKGKDRNKPCICGSGKKIKRCHGEKDWISRQEVNEIHILYNNYLNCRVNFTKALEESKDAN